MNERIPELARNEMASVDGHLLKEISRHNRSLGLRYAIKGLNYERCAELPYIISLLQDRFDDRLRYLDIGSGESPLPSYLLRKSNWDIWCVDKFSWVQRQWQHATRVMGGRSLGDRFHVVEADVLRADLLPESFDVITNISVVEHFEGDHDSKAMAASAQLLKSGGCYIVTTLINDEHYREFHLERDVYGAKYNGDPVFYQRHYDLASLESRIIKPAGLRERSRVYFGDYGYQAFERLFQRVPKMARVFYQWTMPWFARHFLSYSTAPISRRDMPANTASGVILVLEK